MQAAVSGHVAAVEALVMGGANVDYSSGLGATALQMAELSVRDVSVMEKLKSALAVPAKKPAQTILNTENDEPLAESNVDRPVQIASANDMENT
mmetsp:Transcript_63894/g.106247  ORF Transcript_63894/g.106247 Transcript_63894/m.106247 type:complete len:94 (+) Transcript_63894:2-283(+)